MELASFQQVPSRPSTVGQVAFGVRPFVRDTARPFLPAAVAQFLYVFDCVQCIETWISEPERIGGVRVEPPFRIWLRPDGSRDEGEIQAAWDLHGLELVRALNVVLPSALDESGFADVREEGYPDRLMVFPKGFVFAYEDPTEAFSSGLCLIERDMRVSASLTAHRRACTVLKQADGEGHEILNRDLLSALLTYGHTGKSFIVLEA